MMSHLLAVRKGEDVMSTKTGNMRWGTLLAVVGTVIAAWVAGPARADVASDQPGAILVYPKIVVDTSGVFGPPTDTEIQITNTSNSVVAARCYLVNATSYCSNSGTEKIPCTAEGEANPETRRCPAGGVCLSNWDEVDFKMTLTKRQPVSWKASEGLSVFPCDEHGCFGGQSNAGSFALGTQTDPFFGELKCVEVSPNDFKPERGQNPANNFAGDLKGEATIVSAELDDSSRIDARKYNAIGIQATGTNNNDDTLLVGGSGAEYNGCPNALILNHLFDGAEVSTHAGASSSQVRTDLTVVPCGEDFFTQTANAVVLQFLVYNEFEQRFSTSTNFTCFKEVKLSDIDTRPGNSKSNDSSSIFNVAVAGTLSGQTRIRSVEGATAGNTVLGVAETFYDCSTGADGQCSAAANLHFSGTRSKGDVILLAPDVP
jgi:hypothetical protein